MRTPIPSISLLVCMLGLAGIASASPALDDHGKCRDHGKFVDAKLCEGMKAPAEHCRDITTKKFAKCSAPNTEPVPEKSESKSKPKSKSNY